MTRKLHAAAIVLSVLAFASSAAAQQDSPAPVSDTAKAEARDRFDRAITLFNAGDNAGALAELKRAYAIIPNALVLYNIGLVHAAMGRSVDAVDALDRVLADPGASVSGDRLARAKQVRDEQERRVGTLSITTSVPAAIEIDNVPVGRTTGDVAAALQIRVTGGVHIVSAIATGHAPAHSEVTVAGGDKGQATLVLVPMEGTSAHIKVDTHLPRASVVVDGQIVGKTPLAQSLTVSSGAHRIELRRSGYVTASRELTLGEGATGVVTLEPEEDPSSAAERGELALDISESSAVVTIDGKSRASSSAYALASGLHRLRVDRGGFEAVERDVTIEPHRTTSLRIMLEPTPSTRAAYASQISSRRTWALVAIGSGLLVAGGGVGFLVWNAGERRTAERDLADGDANIRNKVGVCNSADTTFNKAQCDAPVLDAQSRLDGAKGREPIGYVGVGIGGAALLLGGYLFLSNDDPHRYDTKPQPQQGFTRSIVPFVTSSSHGAVLGVRGEL